MLKLVLIILILLYNKTEAIDQYNNIIIQLTSTYVRYGFNNYGSFKIFDIENPPNFLDELTYDSYLNYNVNIESPLIQVINSILENLEKTDITPTEVTFIYPSYYSYNRIQKLKQTINYSKLKSYNLISKSNKILLSYFSENSSRSKIFFLFYINEFNTEMFVKEVSESQINTIKYRNLNVGVNHFVNNIFDHFFETNTVCFNKYNECLSNDHSIFINKTTVNVIKSNIRKAIYGLQNKKKVPISLNLQKTNIVNLTSNLFSKLNNNLILKINQALAEFKGTKIDEILIGKFFSTSKWNNSLKNTFSTDKIVLVDSNILYNTKKFHLNRKELNNYQISLEYDSTIKIVKFNNLNQFATNIKIRDSLFKMYESENNSKIFLFKYNLSSILPSSYYSTCNVRLHFDLDEFINLNVRSYLICCDIYCYLVEIYISAILIIIFIIYKKYNIIQNLQLSALKRFKIRIMNYHKIIDESKVLKIKVWSSGSSGSVYHSVLLNDDMSLKQVAIKEANENVNLDLKEANILRKCQHKNIISLVGVIYEDFKLKAVVMDFLEYNLTKYLNLKDTYLNSILFNIASDVASGCLYLSEKNIIHRDIASRNVLIEIIDDKVVAKICDFGLAIILENKNSKFIATRQDFSLLSSAPECLNENCFTIESDVWSFGILLWEIFTLARLSPYYGIEGDKVKEHVNLKNIVDIKETFPQKIKELIRECCNYENDKRPSFKKIQSEIDVCIITKTFQ